MRTLLATPSSLPSAGHPTSLAPSSGRPLLLRRLEYLAYPAAAGAAFTLLSLGVVTWLPALAAMARALQLWRADGDGRCFTGTLTAFPHYWRALWRQSLAATVALAVLAANVLHLFGRPSLVAFALLAAQAGIAAALAVLCVALAARAALAPGAPVSDWARGALALGFGSPARGTALLGAAISAAVLSLVVPLGPLLLSPSVPVLLALSFADPRRNLP